MINKEETYVRDKFYMQRHPQLQPKMRAILLDWLMEVSFSVPVSVSSVLLLKCTNNCHECTSGACLAPDTVCVYLNCVCLVPTRFLPLLPFL